MSNTFPNLWPICVAASTKWTQFGIIEHWVLCPCLHCINPDGVLEHSVISNKSKQKPLIKNNHSCTIDFPEDSEGAASEEVKVSTTTTQITSNRRLDTTIFQMAYFSETIPSNASLLNHGRSWNLEMWKAFSRVILTWAVVSIT